MKSLGLDLKKLVKQVRDLQEQMQDLIQSQDWIEEAKKYAHGKSKKAQKRFGSDFEKLKVFLESERKELERLQKKIPTEVKKIKAFVESQKQEFEKVLGLFRASVGTQAKKESAPKKKVKARLLPDKRLKKAATSPKKKKSPKAKKSSR